MAVERAVVFGAPRSGTSFLMDVLDAMPRAACVNGNLFPVGVVHLAAQDLPDETSELLQRSFRLGLADYLESGAYQSRAVALKKWWHSSRSPGGLRRAIGGVGGDEMLIYKEPFIAFAPQLAYSGLPDSRIIYIHRDGRDVADSLVRTYDVLTDEKLAGLDSNESPFGRRAGDRYVPWWVADEDTQAFLDATPYVRAIWMWREMVRHADATLQRPEVLASGRVLRVRYENLVRDPVAEGELILGHLGRPVTPMVLKHLKRAQDRSIGIHRKRPEAEIMQAEIVAASELERLGYLSASGDRSEVGETAPNASRH